MQSKKPSIRAALIWGTAMLLGSWLIRETGRDNDVFLIIMLAGAVSLGIIDGGRNCDLRLWRRLKGNKAA